MEKALIMSDTHGLTQEVAQIVSLHPVQIGFHCGDFCVGESTFPFNKLKLVKGNNDFKAQVPYDQVIDWAGLRFLLTHGHRYHVERSLTNISYKAEEEQVDVVLFGHTHFPYCQKHQGVIYVNPGSLKQPRGFRVPTFVILEVEEEAENKDTKRLSFKYYDHQNEQVSELNSAFVLKK